MTKDFQNRARGMLVGLAVGDALGAPVQFGATSNGIRFDIDKLRNMHDNEVLPKGVWTDDTSMALCLADSLLECQCYDSYDIMEKFCSWENLGYRSYFEYGYDVGRQTDLAICEYADQPVVPQGKTRSENAGNGSIMRLAPMVIAAHNDGLERAVKLAWLSGRETHYSEVAECGTEVFANLLWRAMEAKDVNGDKNLLDAGLETNKNSLAETDARENNDEDSLAAKSEIVRLDNLYFTSDALRECWLDNLWYVESPISGDGENLRDLGGYVLDALAIAIWGFLRSQNFESGMLEVLQLGGDTDTNCAIYGQLAGAYYGFKDIPKRWVENLYLADEIIELADKLAKMKSCPVLRTRFEEDGEDFERREHGKKDFERREQD